MEAKKILIIIENEEGHAHQVLSTKEHKELALKMLEGLDGGIKVDKKLKPFYLEYDGEN